MDLLRKLFYFLMDSLQTLLLAAAVFLFIYVGLFRPFQVDGHSMDPNFENQEFVLTNLMGYQEFMGIKIKSGVPKRGEVIVLVSPVDNTKDYIKRVIGLPAETIMIKDGTIYINNNKLDESKYIGSEVKTFAGSFLHEGEAFVIPENNYIVIGDNRGGSSDSREFGPIKKDTIIGVSTVVYWPPNRTRVIKNPFN